MTTLKNYWAFFILLAVLLIFPLQDPDIFMYLSLGKLFFANNGFPAEDPFLYTYKSWHIYHEWLAYVFYYSVYLVGGYVGLTIAKAVMWNAIFFRIANFASALKAKSVLIYLWLLVAVIACAFRFVERASLISDLFLTILLAALLEGKVRSKVARVALPLMFLIWVNSHPAFIFGLALISAYAALNRNEKHIWITLASCYLACLLNPLFISGFFYPLATVFKSDWAIYRQLNYEWMPTFTGPFSRTAGVKALILILLAAAIAIFNTRKSDQKFSFVLVAAIMFGYLTYSASRFIGTGAIAFTLLGFHTLKNLKWHPKPNLNKYACYALNICTLIAAGYIIINGYTPASGPRHIGFGPDQRSIPVEAVKKLKEFAPGRIFNEYEWGSYLTWELGPKGLLFVHGHIDDPKIVGVDYNNMNRSQQLFDQTVQRYDIKYILLNKPKLFFPQHQPILGFLSGWTVLHQDEYSVLVMRP